MVRVLIIAKTRMSSGVCIGALTRDENKNVRLIPPGRQNYPADTQFDVGQVWDLDFHQAPELSPPHIEDVIVTKQKKIAQVPNVREVLIQRVQPWQGGPHQLFDGLLTFGNSGKGYISKSKGVPISLARWWSPPGINEERCYLQLSGWYL